MKLVSIIVPVYNVEKYLSTCIHSLVDQTYKALEILLIDDGSTDNSGHICDDYAARYQNIRVFHKQNGGLSDARNFGLAHASGEYAIYVDSDDTLSTAAVDKCMNIVQRSQLSVDCVVFYCTYIDELGKCIGQTDEVSTFPSTGSVSGIVALEYLLEDRIQNFATQMLFRIDMWKTAKIHFPVNRLFEDILTTYKVFYNSSNVYFLNCGLYNYRQSRHSITHTDSIRTIAQYDRALTERIKGVHECCPELEGLCGAQEYKRHYSVAMYAFNFKDQDAVRFRNMHIAFLKEYKPDALIRRVFSDKEWLRFLMLRRCPTGLLTPMVSLARKVKKTLVKRK